MTVRIAALSQSGLGVQAVTVRIAALSQSGLGVSGRGGRVPRGGSRPARLLPEETLVQQLLRRFLLRGDFLRFLKHPHVPPNTPRNRLAQQHRGQLPQFGIRKVAEIVVLTTFLRRAIFFAPSVLRVFQFKERPPGTRN